MSDMFDVIFKDVVELGGENYPKRLSAQVERESLFGENEVFNVKLTQEVKGEFRAGELTNNLQRLGEVLDTKFDTPAEISLDSVKETLAEAIGQVVPVYRSQGTVTEEDGTKKAITYYSFNESSGGFEYPNAKVEDLFAAKPELNVEGKQFVAVLDNLVPRDYTPFSGGQPQPLTPPNGTETIRGTAELIIKILKDDGSDFATETAKELSEYLQNNERLSLTKVFHIVNCWNNNSFNIDKLNDDVTGMRLVAMVDDASKRHVPYETIQFSYRLTEDDDKIFASARSRTPFYPNASFAEWTALFHSDDVNILDFKHITDPLEQMGAITKEDAQALNAMTDKFSISGKLAEIIKREGLNPLLEVQSIGGGGNKFVRLITFVKREPDFAETDETDSNVKETIDSLPSDDPFEDDIFDTDEPLF